MTSLPSFLRHVKQAEKGHLQTFSPSNGLGIPLKVRIVLGISSPFLAKSTSLADLARGSQLFRVYDLVQL